MTAAAGAALLARSWLAGAAALALLAMLPRPARAQAAGGQAEGPRLLREPGEVTNVIDGFEPGDPVDVTLSIGFAQSWASGDVYREGPEAGGRAGGLRADRVARFRQQTSRLLARVDVGVFRDVAVYAQAPVVLRDVSELRPRGSGGGLSLGAGEGGADEQLGPLPFRSPERSGLEYVALGVDASPLNQARDPALPSWLVGAEVRLSVGEPRHACGRTGGVNLADAAQIACADPGDVDRDGAPGGSPGPEGVSREGSFSAQRGPGVSRGTTAIGVHTVLSRRRGYLEPYAGAKGLIEFANASSDYADTDSPAVPSRRPPWEAGAFAGLLVIPFEVREQFQRLTFDLRLGANYRSAGRDLSPLFDLLGSSDAPSLRRPALDAAGRVAPGATYATGLSEQSAFTTVSLSGGVQYQVGEYMKFQTGLRYARSGAHSVTGERPCAPRGEGVAAASGPCYEAGLGANPAYRDPVDAPGRRFVVDALTQVDLWLQAVVMF